MKFNKQNSDEKSPRIKTGTTDTPDPDNLPPKFSFRHLQKSYCLSKCQKNEKAAFADRMHKLSQLTWANIRLLPRHGLGFEIISRSSIKTEIPTFITEDINLIAFRFFGNAPMVGYKAIDGTFYILWFDRDYTLYDHQ